VPRLARLTGGVPCNEVLPTTTKALHRDGRGRWGGRTLTEQGGTSEGGEVGLAAVFDGGNGASIVGGEGFLQLEGSTEG
jgi:hypothetical protein